MASKDSADRRAKPDTVASWADRWQDAVPKQRSESTRRHHQERVRAFVAKFGPVELRDLDRGRLREWGEAHPGNVASVRAMLNDAVTVGLLEISPFPKLQVERRDPGEVGLLDGEELDELVRCAGRVLGPYGKVVYGPMIEVAAWTGLGPDELYALAPADVDLAGRRIVVRRAMNSKTLEVQESSSPREVALLEPAERALRSLGLEELPPDEPIFRTAHGKPFVQRMQHYYWNQVRAAFAASLPEGHWLRMRGQPLRFGELQHFFGARLGERDVSPSDIADQLGQRDGGKLAKARYTRESDAVSRVLRAFDQQDAA